MKHHYEVEVRSLKEIAELPNAWMSEDFKKIMDLADFEDWGNISEGELKDYTLMALQDMDPDEAAEVVLSYQFQDRLNSRQIQNMAHDMIEEKLWEEYQEPSLHKELFNCAVMLKWAFPNLFPETEAAKCEISVKALNKMAHDILNNADKSLLLRMVADGMDDRSVLKRLYGQQINQPKFPEAEHIIWDFEKTQGEECHLFTIYSSYYWLKPLDNVSFYNSQAYSDLNPAMRVNS